MLDEHTDQLGIEFAKVAPRLAAAGLVDATVLLPQLEEQLDLPAGSCQDECLLKGQQVGRGIGDQDGPVGQSQSRLADCPALVTGSGVKPAAPLLGNVWRPAGGPAGVAGHQG